MPLPTFYQTGVASIANGATTVTFSGALLGTDADPTIQAGDLFFDPAQPAIPGQRIASVDYDAGTAELWANWPGTTMSADAYEVRFTGDPVRSTAQTRKLLEELSAVQANGRGLFYVFDDTTADADPGAGKFRLNNATIASATGGYIDNLDANGATASGILDTWDDTGVLALRGQLWLRSIATPSTFAAFNVTGSVVDGTGYRKLTLSYVGGSGALAAGDEIMVMFSPVGPKGTNAILGDWQGAWTTATTYAVDDLVEEDGSTYICLVGHTSGTFATDLAAGKWELAVEKGDQGDPGLIGDWKGAWVTATAYDVNDAVSEGGSSYICIEAHTSGTFSTDLAADKWELVASKGDPGNDGATGPAGPTIIVEPRGRLTLASGVSVSASDLVGQTTIYYTPSGGGQIPIYDGSALVPTDFSQISHPLDSTLTHTNPHAQNGIYDEFVINDAGTVRLGSGPMWKTSGTVTMTVASPCVVTYTAHGAIDGAPIVFTTTGALPTGLTAGTTYFVKSPTTNTFNVAATPGGAAINTTGTQSGTHTATLSTGSPGDSRGRGSGAGTTELEFIQGIPVNKNAITIRYGSGSGDTVSVPARRATYVGSFCATANGQATDSLDRRLLYNAFNQAPRPMRRTDLGTNWTYSTNAYRQWHGDAENKLAVLFGLAGGMAEASFTAVASSSTATKRVVQTAIGINSTSQAITSTTGYLWLDTTPGSLQARYRGCPGLGRQDIIPLENGGASDTQTWYGTNNDTTQFRTGIVGSVIY